jgi:hypothetical protein
VISAPITSSNNERLRAVEPHLNNFVTVMKFNDGLAKIIGGKYAKYPLIVTIDEDNKSKISVRDCITNKAIALEAYMFANGIDAHIGERVKKQPEGEAISKI